MPKRRGLRDKAEFVGLSMGVGPESSVSSPLIRKMVAQYRDLEKKIFDRYERGVSPAALEAKADRLLSRIEGAYEALIEEGEPQVRPTMIVEAELAGAWQEMLDDPLARASYDQYVARGRKPEIVPAHWACSDVKKWGRPDCPKVLVPESQEWPYLAMVVRDRLGLWGDQVDMDSLMVAAEEAWHSRQQLIRRIMATKSRRTSRKSPLEETKAALRRVTRRKRMTSRNGATRV